MNLLILMKKYDDSIKGKWARFEPMKLFHKFEIFVFICIEPSVLILIKTNSPINEFNDIKWSR